MSSSQKLSSKGWLATGIVATAAVLAIIISPNVIRAADDPAPTRNQPQVPEDTNSCNTSCTSTSQCEANHPDHYCFADHKSNPWHGFETGFEINDDLPFSSYKALIHPEGYLQEHVVFSGQLYSRNVTENDGIWKNSTENISNVGSGVLTSFSSFVHPQGYISQHIVRGGKLYSRTSQNNWTPWTESTSNIASVGSGQITSFMAMSTKDGQVRQHLVRGGKAWSRTNVWESWKDSTPALTSVGNNNNRLGPIVSFSLSQTQDPDKYRQVLVRGWKTGDYNWRDNTISTRVTEYNRSICRLKQNPFSNTCQAPVKPGNTPPTQPSPTPPPSDVDYDSDVDYHDFFIHTLHQPLNIFSLAGVMRLFGLAPTPTQPAPANCQGVPIKSISATCTDQGYTVSLNWNKVEGATSYAVAFDDDEQFWADKNGPAGEQGEMVQANATSNLSWSKQFDTDISRYFKVRVRESDNCTPRDGAYGQAKIIQAPVCEEPDPSPAPPGVACNQRCDSNADCAGAEGYTCSFQNIWNNATSAVSNQSVPGSSGSLSSFTIYENESGHKFQYLTKNGRIWHRNNVNNWSPWRDITNQITDGAGSGPITSFARFKDADGVTKYHMVRNGVLYYKDDGQAGFNTFAPHSKANGVGSGNLLSFTVFIRPTDGVKVQHVVRTGGMWQRTYNEGWSAWSGNVASNLDGVGDGNLRSFSAQRVNGGIRQYVVRNNTLWERQDQPRANVCRNQQNPKSTTCSPN